MSRRNSNRVNPNAPRAAVDIPASPPLPITEDDRAMLLGFAARRQSVVLQARNEIAAIDTEQIRYLQRIADRLGIDPARLGPGSTIDLDALTVTPTGGNAS